MDGSINLNDINAYNPEFLKYWNNTNKDLMDKFKQPFTPTSEFTRVHDALLAGNKIKDIDISKFRPKRAQNVGVEIVYLPVFELPMG